MSIREKVARAIFASNFAGFASTVSWDRENATDHREYFDTADAAITAFLEAAATIPDKDGRTWRMVPEEATEEMALQGARDIGKTMRFENHIERAKSCHRAMNAAAPKFEWDK